MVYDFIYLLLIFRKIKKKNLIYNSKNSENKMI